MKIPLTQHELVLLLEQAGLLPDPQVEQALAFVANVQANQFRIGGGSALEEHIYPVAALVVEESATESRDQRCLLVVAAILHDVVEDCGVSLATLRAIFGEAVAELVDCLSDVGKTVEDYFAAISRSLGASLIKLCDRRCNLATAHKIADRQVLLDFCQETLDYVLPMAAQIRPNLVGELQAKVAELTEAANV